MDLPPQPKPEPPTPQMPEFAEPPKAEPLEWRLDVSAKSEAETSAELSLTTVETPEKASDGPRSQFARAVSNKAIAFFTNFAEIDFDSINDAELKPARMRIGLTFMGFAGLGMTLLLVYISSLHPELNPVERIREYWHPYIWFVCLGVAGIMMLGRELIRPRDRVLNDSDKAKIE